jgi:GNAT superfamily N-acetyltransferase
MNWYKKAQYEDLNQLELVKMIQKLNPIYLELLDKKWKNNLSPEEEVSMDQIGNKLDLLGNIKRKKIEEQREPSKNLIEEGKPHEVLPMNFMDYHRTGGIEENAYKQYETKEGISWLGPIEKYPKLIKKEDYKGEEIEFRSKEEKLKYTQKDPADQTGWDFLKDEQGELIYMSDEQMREKGIPLYSTDITAFNSAGEPIGWVSNEFGADGVWVVKEYQGRGIGTDLLHEFRKQFKPERRIGQMTGSGQNMTRSYHKKLVEEALKEGKEIPMETLQHYELV